MLIETLIVALGCVAVGLFVAILAALSLLALCAAMLPRDQ